MPGFADAASLNTVHIHTRETYLLTGGFPAVEITNVSASHGNPADHQIVFGNHGFDIDMKTFKSRMCVPRRV
ncbi:hypothetical protein PEC301645_12790 [Pectobacterium carotovorum subsp. carotovorum]|nr:hypothetical protein PEC301645_12790 [Pectobacterium carotovorum subsp. carotovorum]